MGKWRLTLQLALLLSVVWVGLGFSRRSQSIPKVQTGLASFYSEPDRGDTTASGEPFNPDEYVAAHPHFPIGTVVRVTNLQNGRSVNVRIIDRGPTASNRYDGVIIDLSKRAAEKLGFKMQGRTRVRTEVIKWGKS